MVLYMMVHSAISIRFARGKININQQFFKETCLTLLCLTGSFLIKHMEVRHSPLYYGLLLSDIATCNYSYQSTTGISFAEHQYFCAISYLQSETSFYCNKPHTHTIQVSYTYNIAHFAIWCTIQKLLPVKSHQLEIYSKYQQL